MASIGQLAATTPASIVAASGGHAPRCVSIIFYNSHAGAPQVVEITITRGGTELTFCKATLQIKEQLVLENLNLEAADVVKAASTSATTTNYIVLPGNPGAPLRVYAVDANGAQKQGGVLGSTTATGDLTLGSGADLVFSGTTGQCQIQVADNLADALSLLIAAGADFLQLDSTDSAEKWIQGASGQFHYLRTGAPLGQKLTAGTITTVGAGTYSAANVLGGLILRDPNGADRTDTTATAAQLVAAFKGVAVDDCFPITIVNTADAAETITLAGGTGVTLVPATITIAQNEIFHGLVRFTNVTASSEAVTIYGGNVAG